MYSATDSAGRERYYAADSSSWVPREVATSGVADVGADSIVPSHRSYWWDESGRAFYILAVHHIFAVSMPDGVVRSAAAGAGGEGTARVCREAGA